MLSFEKNAWDRGIEKLAGVDEAGRGPLAGPVCAAAVVLDPIQTLAGELPLYHKIDDSKKLTARAREEIYGWLTESEAIVFGVCLIDVEEIDRINILKATRAAMRGALAQLDCDPQRVLVDGRPIKDLHPRAEFIVKGDAKSLSIAAASIIAKVTRDRYMLELDQKYPQYGFASHKGYGTRRHLAAIRKHGPCPHHRRSFKPVASMLKPKLELP